MKNFTPMTDDYKKGGIHLQPSMEVGKRRNKKLIIFLVLSISLHLVVAFLLPFANWQTAAPLSQTVFVDVDPKNDPALAQALRELREKGQIVETAKSDDESTPKDTKYLSEHNQNVKEQTKARKVDIFNSGGGREAENRAGREGPKTALQKLAPPSKITPPTQAEIDGIREQQKQELKQAQQAGGENGSSQEASSSDQLKDIKEGNQTILATKEAKYFSYYHRMRVQFESAWRTRLRNTFGNYLMAGRNLATDKDYITTLIVLLDREGKIVQVQVVEKSGVKDLDQVAVDAFNQAGPFPDPPSGLVDDDGFARVTWTLDVQS